METVDIYEVPLTSATALDSALAGTLTRSAVQKLRQELRKTLGAGRGFSIGRLGTIQVENVAMLPCLETAGRWSRAQARRLVDAYQAAGLGELIHSSSYVEALELTGQAVRETARVSPNGKSGIVARALAGLVGKSRAVREITEQMHEINHEVDLRLPEFRRLPGQLVRVEGREAIVVLDNGEREELRAVDAGYLSSMGIDDSGDVFIQQILQWSPDTVASVYIPALDLAASEGDRSEFESDLAAAETALPTPQAA